MKHLETFKRGEYYSQTEAVKKFKLSVKSFKRLLVDHHLEVISRPADLGEFQVIAIYVKKEHLDRLILSI